ncbi:peptidylprolyl isomerase [Bacillus manliponensis]|uniref:Foldase protein PrsA n=1 Tax=Bacillus manliponensis TaxID=574376 RepID=A0A073K0U9_9BACI|nr:peptidylprolyl isomerase PrsA [Bacillus manliponensis]KEK20196.1 peptidylprolyl isomerase [Bacillus manliponensis]
MKSKKLYIAAATLGTLMLAACGSPGNSDPIATSKTATITKQEFDEQLKERFGKNVLYEMMAQEIMTEKYKVSDKEVDTEFKKIKEQMGDNFKLSLEQSGFKNEDEFKEQIRSSLAIDKAVKKTITEEDIKARHKPEIKASHILVSDEETAKDLKKQLDEGASFEELAKEHSEDPGSKENGGDLDYFGSGKMVPEFEEAAYKLEVGQISDPVKSSKGYHIIKLTDKKELKPYDEVKDDLRKELENERIQDNTWRQKVLTEELKKADIKVKDSDLKDTFSAVLEQ